MNRVPPSARAFAAMALTDLSRHCRPTTTPPKRTNAKQAKQAAQKKARAITRRNRA
jgi:hypothetical protein